MTSVCDSLLAIQSSKQCLNSALSCSFCGRVGESVERGKEVRMGCEERRVRGEGWEEGGGMRRDI